LLTHIRRYTKPYTSEIEVVEHDLEPRSYPFGFPESGLPVKRWWEELCAISQQSGLPVAYPNEMQDVVKDIGFEDVSHKVFRCPYWPGSDKEDAESNERSSALLNSTIGSYEATGTNVYTTLALPHFVTHMGRTEEQVIEQGRRVVKAVKTPCTPLYNNVSVELLPSWCSKADLLQACSDWPKAVRHDVKEAALVVRNGKSYKVVRCWRQGQGISTLIERLYNRCIPMRARESCAY
jgi:hypothetical protein